MSSHEVKAIEDGAILVANDLRTGRTIYYTAQNNWSEDLSDARVLSEFNEANQLAQQCRLDVTTIIDPYLVATDKAGNPNHIREAIRTLGPTFETNSCHKPDGDSYLRPR